MSKKPPDGPVLTQAEHAQLLNLFTVQGRLDPLIPLLPGVLARLRSLQGLHAQAASSVHALKMVEDGDKRMEEELKELSDGVENVKEGLGNATEGILKNWEGLEARLKALEGRISAL